MIPYLVRNKSPSPKFPAPTITALPPSLALPFSKSLVPAAPACALVLRFLPLLALHSVCCLHYGAEYAKDGGDTGQISLSSAQGGNAKASVEMNNTEDPKLGVDRQQMKRKKGGGYNLRKSLAWDRAFFTEEGVLDPMELSILSGNVDSCSGERLSVIHEEAESVSKRLESVCESTTSQILDDSFIRKSPASTPKRRNIDGLSSLNSRSSTRSKASTSTSAVKLKAMSGRDANKSASKHSGCPRPVASSSLKRPLQSSTSKVSNKDPKVSKASVPKPNLTLSPAIAKTSTSNARTSKISQISQPGASVHAHKTMGQKGGLGSAKIPRNDRKPAQAGKSTTRSTVQARRHVVKSVPELHSPANREPLEDASNTDCGLRALKNPVVGHSASCSDGSVTKDAMSISQNGKCNDKNVQMVQIQPAKPSGLRMPSPSLRYFDQSKPSRSQCLAQITPQPGNVALSGTPSYQEPLRPSRGRAVHLGSECASLSGINGALPVHITSDLEMKDKVIGEAQVFHESKGCDTVNCEQSSCNIIDSANLLSQDCIKSRAIAKISHADDIELQRECDSLFVQSVQEEILPEHNGNKPTDCSPEISDIIKLAVETEVFPSKACMISSQNVEGGEASVSRSVHATSLRQYQYVEGAVDYDISKVPEDQMSSGPVHNKKSREKGHLEFRINVEGGEYSEFGRSNYTEDAVNSGIENVPEDQLCSIRTNDRSDLDSNAETRRPYVTSTEKSIPANENSQRQNLKVLDASLKVEATPTGESDSCVFSYSHEECTKKYPGVIDSNVKESEEGDANLQPLETSSFVGCDHLMSMPQIRNCEAGTQTEQPRLAPVGFHSIDSGLSVDNIKGEAGILEVVTTCHTDICSHSDSLCQRQLDVSDVQPEDASGNNDTIKRVILCSEASESPLLQLEKTFDLTVGPENQTHECNNWSNTKVYASVESESENIKCGQSQSEVVKLENEFDRDQQMIQETLPGCAELQDSDGGSFLDMSNIIITRKLQERCEESNMCGQPQFQVFEPETGFSENQDIIKETFMEHAGVQESDDKFVYKSIATNCETRDESEENNMSGHSRSEAMKPENEFVGERHAVEEIIMKDEEVQGSDGNFVGFSNVINSERHEGSEGHTERPKADHFVEEVSSDNWVSYSSDSLLHPRISCAESQGKDAIGEIISRFPLERYSGSYRSKGCNASVDGQVMLQELTPNEVKKRKCHSLDEKSWYSSVIQQSYDNIRGRTEEKWIPDDQVSNQPMLSLESSLRISGHEIPVTAITGESNSDNEKSGLGVNPSDSSGESMVQDMDTESSQDNILLEVDKISDIDSEVQQEIDNEVISSEPEKTEIQTCLKPVNGDKEAAIRPPPDAEPFSDEWLAAIEAAGEEMLTKKSGAVQHSPPDKSQPEPGPWSPVCPFSTVQWLLNAYYESHPLC
ncbi:hypothetical protein LINPERPRIM_LOCUS7142 [Linum perenne]